jgi:uncharacterized protein
MTNDRVLLTGASGLIGRALMSKLKEGQVETVRLVRGSALPVSGELSWNPYSVRPIAEPSARSLEGISAVIHLSGANIASHRWTRDYKDIIHRSRQQPTHALARMLAGLKAKPRVLISASAIGIYGDRGDNLLNEASSPGSDFLANVCQAWEAATQPASEAGIRVVHLRFGVVLSRQGGALAQMLPLFRLGLGGRLGNGRQWMSWVGLPDLLRVIEFTLDADHLTGPVNVVAPFPVTNADFTRTLGHSLRRPTLLPAPAAALKLIFGEMAENTMLASQRAVPERLQAAGFHFQYPDLEAALTSEIR